MIFRSALIFPLSFLLCSAAGATVDSAGTALAAADQGAIVVTGQRGHEAATRTATKTDTELKDVPQSIAVVSEDDIEDRDLRSVAELLRYVPGATTGTGEGNRDQITLRGNNSTADFFVDGVRDDVQYFRDLYNAARIEVLRGPNAMIFGRGGGGGVVNRVTKQPGPESDREFALSGDSQGGYRLAADVDQPLGGGAGLRINGVYENGESFRRGVELERYGVNPTLGFLFGETRIDLAYEYFHDRRTADRGIPSRSDGNPLTVDGPLKGADAFFFGDPEGSFARADVNLLTLRLEHRFGDGLTLRNRTLYGDYDKFYQNIYPNGPAELNGQVRLSAYNDATRRQNLFGQTDLVWESRLGGIDQTLLLGFELGRQEGRNQRRNGVFATAPIGPTSILVPVASPTVDRPVAFLANGAHNELEASIAAIYVQDQIQLSDRVELVAGLRLDRFTLDVANLNTGRTFSRTDELFSPRLGLIVKPEPKLSLYASYSRSYLPSAGDQFSSLDITSEALKPERFDNYEVGAKWEPVDGLLATVALYQLDRTNTRVSGATPGTVALTGAQRSRGLELALQGDVSGHWQIAAGYALQEAEIRRATAAAPAGREVPLVPHHQFSLWNRYNVGKTLGVGLGIIAASRSYASISNAVTLPGYARFDAALFFALADGIDAQLNVENLLGADYFPTAHNDNNIAPGAPTAARATLRFHF